MQPLPTFSCAFGFRSMFTPCKGIQILEYRKFFLVESREIFYCAIRNPEHWNSGYNSRNLDCPTSDWTSESKFHRQRLESSAWNLESMAWNSEFKIVLDYLTRGEHVYNFTLHLSLKGKYFCQSYLKIFKVYNIIPKLHKNKVCS